MNLSKDYQYEFQKDFEEFQEYETIVKRRKLTINDNIYPDEHAINKEVRKHDNFLQRCPENIFIVNEEEDEFACALQDGILRDAFDSLSLQTEEKNVFKSGDDDTNQCSESQMPIETFRQYILLHFQEESEDESLLQSAICGKVEHTYEKDTMYLALDKSILSEGKYLDEEGYQDIINCKDIEQRPVLRQKRYLGRERRSKRIRKTINKVFQDNQATQIAQEEIQIRNKLKNSNCLERIISHGDNENMMKINGSNQNVNISSDFKQSHVNSNGSNKESDVLSSNEEVQNEKIKRKLHILMKAKQIMNLNVRFPSKNNILKGNNDYHLRRGMHTHLFHYYYQHKCKWKSRQ